MAQQDLSKSCDILINDLLSAKEGDVFAITADMTSDKQTVDAIASSALSVGVKLLVIWNNTPGGVSEAADNDIACDALVGALSASDVWIELNSKWLLYSNIYYRTMKNNRKLRHVCLTGVNARGMVSCVGMVDHNAIRDFSLALRDRLRASKFIRMTSSLGEDISFENSPNNPINCKLSVIDKPGTHLFAGNIGWTPDLESINGKIIFDGSVAPDIGILTSPVEVHVEAGAIIKIEGKEEAKAYEKWLKDFNHPQMMKVAHTGIGFNPGAIIAGNIIEDQRVMGSTTWGFGSIGAGLMPPNGVKAPSHSDAVCLRTTLEVDSEILMKDGTFVSTNLANLANRLKKL
jgi:leucyl aminopeptidase (aminopeptidase T)